MGNNKKQKEKKKTTNNMLKLVWPLAPWARVVWTYLLCFLFCFVLCCFPFVVCVVWFWARVVWTYVLLLLLLLLSLLLLLLSLLLLLLLFVCLFVCLFGCLCVSPYVFVVCLIMSQNSLTIVVCFTYMLCVVVVPHMCFNCLSIISLSGLCFTCGLY